MERGLFTVRGSEYRLVYQSRSIPYTTPSNLCTLIPEHSQQIWSEENNDPGMQTNRLSSYVLSFKD